MKSLEKSGLYFFIKIYLKRCFTNLTPEKITVLIFVLFLNNAVKPIIKAKKTFFHHILIKLDHSVSRF